MSATLSPTRQAASSIYAAFHRYSEEFLSITRRARTRFECREWGGAQADAVERLTLYGRTVDDVVNAVKGVLAGDLRNRSAWRQMKQWYAQFTSDRADAEIAWTFFSSVTRRVFGTVGVNQDIEFVGRDFDRVSTAAGRPIHATYPCDGPLFPVIRWILDDLKFGGRFPDLARDAGAAAAVIEAHLAVSAREPVESFEMLPFLFYRNTRAFLVGRIRTETGFLPLIFALTHPADGIRVDAVLPTADEASIVFGFTRSYFHAISDHPRAVVDFLQTIMPHKRRDELYTSIGYNKHGKTELYRSLLHHLANDPAARFVAAEGDKGLVMSVFALPSFSVVFKVIKDRFGQPKTTSRQAVREKYHLVFVHDRVGRLADAQEFERLTFPRDRFDEAVLEELAREAPSSLELTGREVTIKHLYTERQVTPLNLFLRRSPPEQAVDAIVDYGAAIKELAAANIFTGDMLLKNFGVTRHGRVIFYDYDELCLLTDCTFRHLPQATNPEDELGAEAWFPVSDRDVFPEEFRPVVSLPGPVGQAFAAAHEDLLTVEFWRGMQERQAAGEEPDVMPYRQERRLRADGPRG